MPQDHLSKLDVGCGSDARESYVNFDLHALPGIDVAHDLTVFPCPFDDDSFVEILVRSVPERLPSKVRTMDELWRICPVGERSLP